MTSMIKKAVIGGIASIALVGAVATPASAGNGGAVAAGVVGGLALGAIAGSAAANNGYNNGYYAPAYGPPPAVYGGGCYFQRRPVYDEYGEVVGHRRIRVCE